MTPDEARKLFPSIEQQLWMQHAGGSPTSTRVHDALVRAADLALESMNWAEGYGADRDALRGLLARMIGGMPEHIVLTRSTGHGLSLLARGLDWRPGDNVVGARGEFPTNLYPWMALGRQGVDFRLVETVNGKVTPEGVLEQIDDRTRVVALSWVQFWNGYRIDVDRIGKLCRERGVIFALDAIQGLGAVRLDVSRSPVDFVTAGAIKWLMGPGGIGFCWMHPGLLPRLEPLTVGVGSVANPTDYFNPVLEWHPTGKRFEESGVSWFDITAWRAGLELLEEVGHEVVESRVLDLTTKLAAGLVEAGCAIVEPWPRSRTESSGIISFRSPTTSAEVLVERFRAAGVMPGKHADFVRLSPHFYNSPDDIDRVLRLVASSFLT